MGGGLDTSYFFKTTLQLKNHHGRGRRLNMRGEQREVVVVGTNMAIARCAPARSHVRICHNNLDVARLAVLCLIGPRTLALYTLYRACDI